MEKEAEEVDHPRKVEESTLSHGKAMISASLSCSKSWIGSRDLRIVRVSRAFGGKDRHSKVCTIKGLRDRRVRLSVPTAVQLYDLQDRLGLSQPSKVVDWLLEAAKHEINKLPPLPVVPGTNFVHSIHHPRLLNLDGLVRASSSSDPDAWITSVSASKRDLREAVTMEHVDDRRHHHSRKGSREQSQESNGYDSDYHLSLSNNMPGHHSYNGISQVIFRSSVSEATRPLVPNSILGTPGEDEVRQTTTDCFSNEFTEFPARP